VVMGSGFAAFAAPRNDGESNANPYRVVRPRSLAATVPLCRSNTKHS
jgi:hypothetical protein